MVSRDPLGSRSRVASPRVSRSPSEVVFRFAVMLSRSAERVPRVAFVAEEISARSEETVSIFASTPFTLATIPFTLVPVSSTTLLTLPGVCARPAIASPRGPPLPGKGHVHVRDQPLDLRERGADLLQDGVDLGDDRADHVFAPGDDDQAVLDQLPALGKIEGGDERALLDRGPAVRPGVELERHPQPDGARGQLEDRSWGGPFHSTCPGS